MGLKALYDREKAIRPREVLAEGLRLRQAELDALFLDERGEVREELVTWRKTCPTCGAETLRPRAKSKRWPMVVCSTCGGETIAAVPTSAAWTRFYATSRADALFHRKLYEGTKEKRLAVVDEPRVKWIKERCPTPGRLLDIGCSSGAFLEALQANSAWECHGIEPNPEAVKVAHEKGLTKVVCTQLEDFHPSVRFDAVTSFSALTQLDDPLQSLERIRSIMKPGGRFFCAEMNFAGFYAAVTGEDHSSFVPPILKTFLTSTTVVTMLEKAGFTDVEVTTPGQLDLVRILIYWEGGGKNGRTDALYRLLAHELETDSTRLQTLLVESKASEHMWVTARVRD